MTTNVLISSIGQKRNIGITDSVTDCLSSNNYLQTTHLFSLPPSFLYKWQYFVCPMTPSTPLFVY